MEAQDVSIGEIRFKVRPLGAMNAAYVFGDVTAIVLPIMGTVAVSSGNDDEASGMEMFQGMNLDSESLANALGKINGQKLTALLDELVLLLKELHGVCFVSCKKCLLSIILHLGDLCVALI